MENLEQGQETIEVKKETLEEQIIRKDKESDNKDKRIKSLEKEVMTLKQGGKTVRPFTKVFIDTGVELLDTLSLRDRGLLYSLAVLASPKGYLQDKETGCQITSWRQLGKNVGIKDVGHARNMFLDFLSMEIMTEDFKLNSKYLSRKRNA
ncbi:MAG: hypothetical protein LKJ99_00190 [Acidaminococcaceae bacterium]|nr:hypothetical protein [Acidaminococcaceae bacterium]